MDLTPAASGALEDAGTYDASYVTSIQSLTRENPDDIGAWLRPPVIVPMTPYAPKATTDSDAATGAPRSI